MVCFPDTRTKPPRGTLIGLVLCVALLAGGALGAHKTLTGSVWRTKEPGDNMASTQDSVVLHRLLQCEQTGRLDGLEIEIWTGGGQPPPYYRSDQFRLLVSSGRDVLEFARIKFDAAYEPPDIVEKFQLMAQPADVQTIARLLRETGVFSVRYAEEENPNIPDILSTEVIVTHNGQQHKRVYYRTIPKALIPLKAEIDRLIEQLIAHGERQLYHRGKRIG